MKKSTIFIQANIQAVLFAFICFFGFVSMTTVGCGSAEDKSAETTENRYNEQKVADQSLKQNDVQNLSYIAELSLQQIQVGRLAQSNSSNKDVKSLAAQMEAAYNKALNELHVLATQKVMTIPKDLNENGIAFIDRMKNKNGTEFDKTYCNIMVNDHLAAIETLDNIASTSPDEDIRFWASQSVAPLKLISPIAKKCKEQNSL